jgi:RimJ/RimL family protein N-acetyltransferase
MGSDPNPDGLFHFNSERLVYRAVENCDSDKEFLQTQILNDPTIQTMSTSRLKRPKSQKTAEDFIKMIQDSLLGVIICLPPPPEISSPNTDGSTPKPKPKPVPIGHMSIFHTFPPGSEHNRCAMLGISLAEGFRGKGYGGEAINWALEWAFQYAGLHRVNLCAFSYNVNALKLYRKLGFVDEGREREAIYHRRTWYDLVMLGMLEHEWEVLRGIK